MVLSVPAGEDPSSAIPAFSFHVAFVNFTPFDQIATEITGGFTDVTGLEATMEPKDIREGGRNYGTVQRAGAVTFATVVFKRGIIESRHLWQWWSLFAGGDGAANGGWGSGHRCDITIALMRSRNPVLGWRLKNAMPVKFRVGDLNAKAAELAVEELHVVHEGLNMEAVA